MSWTTDTDIPRSITQSYSLACTFPSTSALNGPPASTHPRLSPNQGASNLPFNTVFKSDVNSWPFEHRDKTNGMPTNSHQKPITRLPKFEEVAYSHQSRYIATSQADMPGRFNLSSATARREEPATMTQALSHQLNTYKCLSGMSMTSNLTANLAENQQQLQNSALPLSATPQNPSYSSLSRSQSEDKPNRHQTKDFQKQETNAATVYQHVPRMTQDMHDFMPQAHSMRSSSSFLTSNKSSPSGTPMILTPHHCNKNHPTQHGQYNNYFPPSSASLSACSALTGFDLNPCKNASTPILSSQILPIFSSDTSMGVLVGAETRYSQIPTSMPMMLSSPHKQVDSRSSPPLASALSSAFMLACSVSTSSAASPLSSPLGPYVSSVSSPGMSQPLLYVGPSVMRHGGGANFTSHTALVKSDLSSPSSSSGFKKKVNSTNTSTSVIKKQNAAYVCQYPNCGRTFNRPFNLRSHDLTHRDVRPHDCDKCPKTFARIHDLHRHRKGHFPKSYTCIVCQSLFARQDAVTRHLKIADGMNHCGLILKRHRISIRDVAAGRVRRCILGDELAIRKKLEDVEDLVRKARLSKNMNMRSMSANISTLSMNMNAVQQQQLQQQQYHRHSGTSSVVAKKE